MAWVRANLKNMQPQAQQRASTCWLTCYGMLYDWKGEDKTTIGPKLNAAGVDVVAAFNSGLDASDFMRSAKALGLKPWGVGGSWSTADFQRFLAQGPIWIAGQWSPKSPHIVVLTGASDYEVEIIDPWWQGEPVVGVDKRSADFFIHGDGKSVKGSDFFSTRIGSLAVWT